MGPLMLDCASYELSTEEREILQHPMVGGVILFSRNYHDKRQLRALTQEIQQAAKRRLIIGVDHEGGRVQRFREHFSAIPAMGNIAQLTSSAADQEALASACGHILAWELKQVGIDLSFGPVLDVNRQSQVIGDRAFSDAPEEVIRIARPLIHAMQHQGMPATAKHFPGHGSVVPDSHVALPVDERDLQAITAADMHPFRALIADIDAIMPAHVIYAQADENPAGFSPYWLQKILRQSLQFNGVIFSDDLSMHGASVAGNYTERAEAALNAGCDMVLACNNAAGAIHILDNLSEFTYQNPRLETLLARRPAADADNHYQHAIKLLARYDR
ncbi:beta-N-acetylhexosaminidase [Salinimonas sp. HHU 13199]|uniref:Beta-hexosaminidase n=1 Tax=Salinimonas profundi TaxID=2729140 RepID=A0ABR8LKP2_9ALTE|nr:beta-N-acetylhexosaminidase [Salinimonas profundi]MBD3584862.1 beta-N-acetylhexosaminidase [Salinimonas profundi]